MVPGDGVYIKGISYWQFDPQQTRELVQQMQSFAKPADSGDVQTTAGQ